jgi:hypothetical protein
MQTFSTRPMLYSNGTKTLSVDASDVCFAPAAFVRLQSHRTNRLVTFKRVATKRDTEGDVLYWVYEPVSEVGVTALLVFND